MTLAKERKPFLKPTKILDKKRSSSIVYGRELPPSETVTLKIPYNSDVHSGQEFLLLVEFGEERKKAIYSKKYETFVNMLTKLSIKYERGMLLCWNVVMHSCVGVPISQIFDGKTFKVGGYDFTSESLGDAMSNGISVLYDMMKSSLKVTDILKVNVTRTALTKVSENFVNSITEENNAIFSSDH